MIFLCLIIRFVIPVVFIIKLDWIVCICETQLYDGRDTYRIYYIKNNYMFRHFTLAIFRLRIEKKIVSSYTRFIWVVYSGELSPSYNSFTSDNNANTHRTRYNPWNNNQLVAGSWRWSY